jgi:hypothetical protein
MLLDVLFSCLHPLPPSRPPRPVLVGARAWIVGLLFVALSFSQSHHYGYVCIFGGDHGMESRRGLRSVRVKAALAWKGRNEKIGG